MAKKKKIKRVVAGRKPKKTVKPKAKTLLKPKVKLKPKPKQKQKPAIPKFQVEPKRLEFRRQPIERLEFISSPSDSYLNIISRGVFGKSIKSHEGKTFQKKYGSAVVKNEFGEFHLIKAEQGYFPPEVNYDLVNEKLLHNLQAIPGIAELTEANLKREGYKSIKDLAGHLKYSSHATTFLELIASRNGNGLYDQLSSRFTSTNTAFFYNSTYFKSEDVVFLDIESLGLHDCPLFLIGVATVENDNINVKQIFIENPLHEKAGLAYFADHLKGKKAVLTFNGKGFDVPFLKKRFERHDLEERMNLPHFDLQYLSQRALKGMVSDFKLQTIERELLNFRRKDDVPSRLVPQFYESFIRSNNIGAVVPIIEHNKRDLITTVGIYDKLHEITLN
jgi:uncharacterized protein YprB with RNaseH-like and TPR domain